MKFDTKPADTVRALTVAGSTFCTATLAIQ